MNTNQISHESVQKEHTETSLEVKRKRKRKNPDSPSQQKRKQKKIEKQAKIRTQADYVAWSHDLFWSNALSSFCFSFIYTKVFVWTQNSALCNILVSLLCSIIHFGVQSLRL